MRLVIYGDHISLDCQGHAVETNEDLIAFANPLIFAKGNYNGIRNCVVASNHKSSLTDRKLGKGVITLRKGFGIIENNTIKKGRGGIFVDGSYNIIKNNKVANTYEGITVNANQNIIKNNLVKDSNKGFQAEQALKDSFFVNNYAYGNSKGIQIGGDDLTLKCGKYVNNTRDLLILSFAERITAIGTIFNTVNSWNHLVFEEHDCRDVECVWFGDECLKDDDWDGVLNENDKCPDTELPEKFTKFKSKHYADIDGDGIFETIKRIKKNKTIIDSEYTLIDTYGCSCEQILEYKSKKKSKGEIKSGCKRKTIQEFIAQKGWAKDLF